MIEDRFRATVARVRRAAVACGRDPASVTLVAVSKFHGADAVRALHALGHRDFGESRAQELAAKADALPRDIRWHFVGALQANKIRDVKPRVALCHSFDRADLAAKWGADGPPVLLQVNVGREPQKRGVLPEDAPSALAACEAAGARVAGLMAIPPRVADAEAARPFFRAMRELRDALAKAHPAVRALSMGMSEDVEVAVEEGATMVRVGAAIFGERPAA